MRKILLILFLFVGGFFYYFQNIEKSSVDEGFQNIEVESPSSTNSQDTEVDGYLYKYFVVPGTSRITLTSNLVNFRTSKEFIEEEGCVFVVNGGFYDVDGTHIGLFVENNVELSKFVPNSLFNAFIYDHDGQVLISKNINKDISFGLQSGPLLIENGIHGQFNVSSDKLSRRVVAGTTEESNLVFFVIYDKSSVFNGPYLKETPALLSKISEKENIKLVNAINLDGGSASAFISNEFALSELSPVGSYFCIK